MLIRGLKSNIVLTLFFLLSLAMLLIGLVMMNMARKELVRSEAGKARLVLQNIAIRLQPVFSANSLDDNFSLADYLNDHERILFTCMTAAHWSGEPVKSLPAHCSLSKTLGNQTKQCFESGQSPTIFHGNFSGLFGGGQGYLLISQAIFENGEIVGALAGALDLSDLYKKIGKIRTIFFVYFSANLIILVLLGFFLLHRKMVRPIQKMAGLIEGFRDTEDFLLPDPKNDTEFQKLNKSIQRMVRRFSRNREELRSTVSSLEKANKNLQQAQNEIIRAEKLASVGRLSAGIAHEIGNPIGIVLGYFELLKQGGLSEAEQKDFLARAEKETNRINLIIRQLLDLSRSSADGLQVVSVHAILDDLAGVIAIQPLMAKIKLDLEFNAENDSVLADPEQLRQVFLNLIINAGDALAGSEKSAPGRLLVKTATILKDEEKSPRLEISFIDNGPGIPGKVLDTIFDPFFTTKEPGKGTGLGLAVSFMIIESLSGSIEVESEEGEGTAMVIVLPLNSGSSSLE